MAPELIVETTALEPGPHKFGGPTASLVYFLSFAHAERYGSDHALAQAAAILKRRLRINMAPLLTFGDARPEDTTEKQAREMLWQEAPPLAECSRRVAEALSREPSLQALAQQYPGLLERLQELADMASWAAERGAKIRLTYLL